MFASIVLTLIGSSKKRERVSDEQGCLRGDEVGHASAGLRSHGWGAASDGSPPRWGGVQSTERVHSAAVDGLRLGFRRHVQGSAVLAAGGDGQDRGHDSHGAGVAGLRLHAGEDSQIPVFPPEAPVSGGNPPQVR